MIKTFFIWEKHSNEYKPDFKVGDTVICIDDHPNGNLILNKKYKVDKIYFKDTVRRWYCIVSGFNNEKIYNSYYCERFINELYYHVNKYNL
jgi:hypothetical protein